MKRTLTFVLLLVLPLAAAAQADDAQLMKRAQKLHNKIISIDTHSDTGMALTKTDNPDLSKIQGSLDKLKEGRVDCCFYPVYLGQGPVDEETEQAKYELAVEKMKAIKKYVADHSKVAAMAYCADDIVRNKKRGKISIVTGLENAYPIGRHIERVQEFYDLGGRMFTLSHNYNNDVCDASRDSVARWHGLSPFGKEVVAEMNRLGIIVDISHTSTETLYDCLAISTAPIVASHSCVFAIKDHPRNLTDEEIKAIAAKGGVIQVTTGRWALTWLPRDQVNIGVFCDHVEYIRNLVGVEYVGIGTDFDGGGGMNGLEDATHMKDITVELMRRGWTDHELELFWGGNFLRVMRAVENAAKR